MSITLLLIDNLYSNYRTIELVSQASKIMLNILPARLQQYENRELLMFKLVLEKEEEAEMQLPTSAASRKNRPDGYYNKNRQRILCGSLSRHRGHCL